MRGRQARGLEKSCERRERHKERKTKRGGNMTEKMKGERITSMGVSRDLRKTREREKKKKKTGLINER